MSTVGTLLVKIGVNTAPLTAGIAQAKAEMRSLDGSTAKTGSSMAGVGKAVGIAGAAIAAGTAMIGVEAVKSATSYQSAMELLRTQAGASQAQVDSMSKSVLDLATKLPQSPDELAAGLYHVVSAGKSGAEAMNILEVAAKGAAMGGADLESTTNALIAANQSGVKGVENMGQAMGTLNGIVGAGNMRMQDLTDAMGTGVLSTAKNYGVSIQSVGSALASMTDQGVPAIDAATRINSAMRLMAAPTGSAVKALGSIGITQMQLAQDMRGPGGIGAAIDDLKSHLEGSGKSASEQAALIAKAFGGKQSGAILTLIGNTDLLHQKEIAVAKGATAFGDSWTAAQGTTAIQAAELKSSFQVLMIALGQGLIPAVTSLMKTISPIITAIAKWASDNPQLAGTILMIVGGLGALAAAIAFLSPVVAAIGALLGVVFSPVLLPILAIGVAIALVATHFDQFKAGVGVVVNAVGGFLQGLLNAVTGVFAAIGNAISTAVNFIGGIIGKAIDLWVTLYIRIPMRIASWVADIVGQAVKLGQQVVGTVTGFVGSVVNLVLGIPGRIAGMIGGFADIAKKAVAAFLGFIGQIPGKVAGVLHSIPGLGNIMDIGGSAVGAIAGAIPHFSTGAAAIPRDMLAFLHAGEMVVPAGPAASIRSAASSWGGGGSRSQTVNVVVNNPLPEPASTSLRREIDKMQRLTAFGY